MRKPYLLVLLLPLVACGTSPVNTDSGAMDLSASMTPDLASDLHVADLALDAHGPADLAIDALTPLDLTPSCATTCATAADCPATASECVLPVCDGTSHCCSTSFADGTHVLSTGQTAGDCQKKVCDGNGGVTSVDDLTDLPTSTSVCLTSPACTGSPAAPTFTPATSGTDCTGDNMAPAHLCGTGATAGSCVQCDSDTDCTAASCSGTVYTPAQVCTNGTCVSGSTTDCGLTTQQCAASGCVACNFDADCPATGNECAVNTCVGNACVLTNLDGTHAVSVQTPGDCQKVVCNGAGGTTSIDDPTDLPIASSVCLTQPACTGSPLTPSFATAAPDTDCTADNKAGASLCGSGLNAGTCVQCASDTDCAAASCNGTMFTAAQGCGANGACGSSTPVDCATTNMFCDSTVGCVGCDVDGDCPSTGSPCATKKCTNHACAPQNVATNTALPGADQTSGDCQKLVCNGSGGITSIDDPTDLPTSNTVCLTNPACSGPSPLAPSFYPAPTGTDCTADNNPPAYICGDTSNANVAGTCVQCNTNADCIEVNDAGTLTCVNGTCQ